MICDNEECDYYKKECPTIAMYQIDKNHSEVYEWNEITGLGENKDMKMYESPTEHDARKGYEIPYIYQVECNSCGQILIDFEYI